MALRSISLLIKFIRPASLLLCCIVFVRCQEGSGQECSSSYLNYRYINRHVFSFDTASETYEGPVEICVNGEYESVCDIGWDQADADVVCEQLFGGFTYFQYQQLAEPLCGLGDPRNRYFNWTFHCSHDENVYLGDLKNCYSTSTIDKECFNGSHVAGVRCKKVCYEERVLVEQVRTDYHENGLTTYVGQMKVCINGAYREICDVGWDNHNAQWACDRLFRGGSKVGEVDQSAPFNSSYIIEDVSCTEIFSNSPLYLRYECDYSPATSPECTGGGNHSARFTCREVPPPSGLQGFCSVIVWNRPAQLSCGGIDGYYVRLYHPQSPYENVFRSVDSNGTYYVLTDEDKLAGYSYFQVQVYYNGRASQLSKEVFIGCDESTTSEPEVHRVYFELKGNVYLNNSALPLADIGEGTNALLCKTDKTDCCGTRPNRFGEFYYPNGVQVPIALRRHGFYRDRSDQLIRLNRRQGTSSPTGTFKCEIPDADDVMTEIYITLT